MGEIISTTHVSNEEHQKLNKKYKQALALAKQLKRDKNTTPTIEKMDNGNEGETMGIDLSRSETVYYSAESLPPTTTQMVSLNYKEYIDESDCIDINQYTQL